MAARIVDGDPTTFWEPDPRDPIEQWWVEVDLGRAVPVEGISVRFVDEDLGDPFFKYLLLLAPNQTLSLTDDRKVSFELFVPHEGPNTEQRAFFFESAAATGGATLAPPVNPGLAVPSGGISSVKKLHPKQRRPGLDRQDHRNHPHRNYRHAWADGPSKLTKPRGRHCRRMNAATSSTSCATLPAAKSQ